MGDPHLSEAPVEPQPTCNGASKADVHAILAAGPKIMPDNIADGRKGCDGLINSGKKNDVCGECEGEEMDASVCPPAEGGSEGVQSSSSGAKQSQHGDSEALTTTLVLLSIMVGLMILSMFYCMCCGRSNSHAGTHGDGDEETGQRRSKNKKYIEKAGIKNIKQLPMTPNFWMAEGVNNKTAENRSPRTTTIPVLSVVKKSSAFFVPPPPPARRVPPPPPQVAKK